MGSWVHNLSASPVAYTKQRKRKEEMSGWYKGREMGKRRIYRTRQRETINWATREAKSSVSSVSPLSLLLHDMDAETSFGISEWSILGPLLPSPAPCSFQSGVSITRGDEQLPEITILFQSDPKLIQLGVCSTKPKSIWTNKRPGRCTYREIPYTSILIKFSAQPALILLQSVPVFPLPPVYILSTLLLPHPL